MWLIFGLGNPGKTYAKTRHNLGFMVIDAFSSKFTIPLKDKSKNFSYGKGRVEGTDIILIKPLTFMNRSGAAVRAALKKYPDIDNMLVVHDDLDLDTGVLKIRKSGSAGGHRGIESIIEVIKMKNFPRLKIGIGRPDRISAEEYVLNPLTKQERPVIKKAVEEAADAIAMIIEKGISQAQNRFHRK
ncbi:MAG: aminoacyl-tRNA hydrolase [Candidatus Mariimomonas ferrooxydans]